MPQLPYHNRPFIRFTGKFRDLIPQGWVFQKLFASNHRCYSKFVFPDRGVTGPSIRVWQLCGGYVEFDDFLEYSYLFAQFLMDDAKVESVKWEAEKELAPGWGKEITSHEFFINMREGYVTCPQTWDERPDKHLFVSGGADADTRNAYYEEWRMVVVRKEFFDACLDMIKSGMIEIVVP